MLKNVEDLIEPMGDENYEEFKHQIGMIDFDKSKEMGPEILDDMKASFLRHGVIDPPDPTELEMFQFAIGAKKPENNIPEQLQEFEWARNTVRLQVEKNPGNPFLLKYTDKGYIILFDIETQDGMHADNIKDALNTLVLEVIK
jgi:hypothetical protein